MSEIKLDLDRNKLQDLFLETFIKGLSKEDAQNMMHTALVSVLESSYDIKRILESMAIEIVRRHLSEEDSSFREKYRALYLMR